MPNKNGKNMEEGETLRQFISNAGSTLWLMLIALWGGTASYISRIRTKKLPFSVIELIGEWCISGFAGIVTMYVCMDLSLSVPITAAATGIAGHMGGRAIYMLENLFLSRLGKK